MADFFQVSEATLNNWKAVHNEFLESITRGKAGADAEVAAKMYERACGYSHSAVKIFNYEGQIIEAPYTEHYPPDTQAASLWLRNRQPKKWRDKQDLEVSGPDGGPIQVENAHKLASVMAPEELEALKERFMKAGEQK